MPSLVDLEAAYRRVSPGKAVGEDALGLEPHWQNCPPCVEAEAPHFKWNRSSSFTR